MKPREFMTFGALFFSFPQFTALFRKGFILTGMRNNSHTNGNLFSLL